MLTMPLDRAKRKNCAGRPSYSLVGPRSVFGDERLQVSGNGAPHRSVGQTNLQIFFALDLIAKLLVKRYDVVAGVKNDFVCAKDFSGEFLGLPAQGAANSDALKIVLNSDLLHLDAPVIEWV